VTPKIRLREGLAIFRVTHQGRSNVIMYLLDGTGRQLDLVANQVGNFDGASAARIPQDGEYLINVTADGAWTIAVEQPRPADGAPLPTDFRGVKSGVSHIFQLRDGLVTFRFKHSGKSNFIAYLVDMNGRQIDLVANGIGVVDGSKAVRGRSMPVLIDVTADGEWSMTVE
jgi:hypothetical protein